MAGNVKEEFPLSLLSREGVEELRQTGAWKSCPSLYPGKIDNLNGMVPMRFCDVGKANIQRTSMRV